MRRAVFGFAIALPVLVGFLFIFDASVFVRQLSGADPGVFSLGLLAVCLALVCWSEATRRLFAVAGATISVRAGFAAYCTGMFGKQILPMGNAGGPAIVAFVYERDASLGYNKTLAIVTIAEFLSLIASLILAVFGVAYLLVFIPGVPELRIIQLGVLSVAGGFLVLVVVFFYRRAIVERAVLVAARLLGRTVGRFSLRVEAMLAPDRVRDGLRRYYETVDVIIANRRSVLVAYVLAMAGWLLFVVPLYTSALALGIQLPVALVLFVVPISGLATIVPLPGGLGGVEVVLAGMLFALTGIELATVAAIVVLYRLCAYWFMVLIGGVTSVYTVTSIRELVSEAPRETGEPHGNHQAEVQHR